MTWMAGNMATVRCRRPGIRCDGAELHAGHTTWEGGGMLYPRREVRHDHKFLILGEVSKVVGPLGGVSKVVGPVRGAGHQISAAQRS